MKKKSPKKPRMIGRGSTSFSRSNLYLMSDHLLKIEGSFEEKYRRFYFKDLQAAFWISNRGALWALSFFILLFTIPGIFTVFSSSPEASIFFFAIAFPALLRLVYVQMRGGYVHFYLSTPAQQVKLPEIITLHKANRIMKLIESHLEQPASSHGNPPV